MTSSALTNHLWDYPKYLHREILGNTGTFKGEGHKISADKLLGLAQAILQGRRRRKIDWVTEASMRRRGARNTWCLFTAPTYVF